MICAGEFNSHVLFAGKAFATLADISQEKIRHMENILGKEISLRLADIEQLKT